MKNDNTHSFQDAFKKFLKDEHLEKSYNEKKLMSMWSEMMGPTIANRTSKLNIHRETLYVTLTSAPLKQEMNRAKERIIQILEEKIGDRVVKDVRFL
jgi:predicted nucleic acid-binding Zn ribbon protein